MRHNGLLLIMERIYRLGAVRRIKVHFLLLYALGGMTLGGSISKLAR